MTYFEDEETFNATAESMEGLAAQEDMEIQTTNSSSKTTNSKNNGNSKDSKQASKMVVDEEDGEEVEEAASVNEKITYKLYRTFWEFQVIVFMFKVIFCAGLFYSLYF